MVSLHLGLVMNATELLKVWARQTPVPKSV